MPPELDRVTAVLTSRFLLDLSEMGRATAHPSSPLEAVPTQSPHVAVSRSRSAASHATLPAFIVQAITGVVLAMYYKPTPNEAYRSIEYITNDLYMGWLVRGMHRWGA